MSKKINNLLVNPETGEVIDTSRYVELEPGDIVLTKKQQEFLQKERTRYQDKTDFVWLHFQYGINLEFSVERSVAVRLLYFGTVCGSDGVIQMNRLMKAKLNLDKNQQTAFLSQTLNAGLLRQDGSAFFVNPRIISRREYDADSNHIRIFTTFYRTLCESTHSQVGLNRIYYFLQMIPYLNRQTNILSHNQTEQTLESVVYMSFNEFCKKINFNTAHSAKLKKQLSDFRVNDELIIGFFDNLSELTPTGKNVILNPKLCFGGDRTINKYKEICALFEYEKSKYLASLEYDSSTCDTTSSE